MYRLHIWIFNHLYLTGKNSHPEKYLYNTQFYTTFKVLSSRQPEQKVLFVYFVALEEAKI